MWKGPAPAMGTVIHLPETEIKPRLCGGCENGYLGSGGVYCIAYAEFIWNEADAASDCPEWEEA